VITHTDDVGIKIPVVYRFSSKLRPKSADGFVIGEKAARWVGKAVKLNQRSQRT
jgi:hypothetical protein